MGDIHHYPLEDHQVWVRTALADLPAELQREPWQMLTQTQLEDILGVLCGPCSL